MQDHALTTFHHSASYGTREIKCTLEVRSDHIIKFLILYSKKNVVPLDQRIVLEDTYVANLGLYSREGRLFLLGVRNFAR